MFKNLRIFFEHNRAERNGTIAIIVISFLFVLGSFLFGRFYHPDLKDLGPLISYVEEQESSTDHNNSERHLFAFSPNNSSDSVFNLLGFSENEIKMIRNYQSAGGTFKVKSDFRKLYFMDDKRFEEYYPFIQLPDSTKPDNPKSKGTRNTAWSDTASYVPFQRKIRIVELNSADTIALKTLPAIGSYYANKIVEYREELGGYYNLGQLLELWKMTPDKIDQFADKVTINKDLIKPLMINSATTQELARHPYISFELASRIVLSRESNGPFTGNEDLKKRELVNDDLSSKLAAYLQFD